MDLFIRVIIDLNDKLILINSTYYSGLLILLNMQQQLGQAEEHAHP